MNELIEQLAEVLFNRYWQWHRDEYPDEDPPRLSEQGEHEIECWRQVATEVHRQMMWAGLSQLGGQLVQSLTTTRVSGADIHTEMPKAHPLTIAPEGWKP